MEAFILVTVKLLHTHESLVIFTDKHIDNGRRVFADRLFVLIHT